MKHTDSSGFWRKKAENSRHDLTNKNINIINNNHRRISGRGRGGGAPPFFKTFLYDSISSNHASWKSFYKMLFNSIFRNVNVTLHHEYAHNAVRSISWKVKFSFKEGGEGVWGLGPWPMSAFCASACQLSLQHTSYAYTRGGLSTLHVQPLSHLRNVQCVT